MHNITLALFALALALAPMMTACEPPAREVEASGGRGHAPAVAESHFELEKMRGAADARRVHDAVIKIPGVTSALVLAEDRLLIVSWVSDEARDEAAVVRAVSALGIVARERTRNVIGRERGQRPER